MDKIDANPGVLGEQDEEGDDTRSTEDSGKKFRKSAVVPTDGPVTARIKELNQKITGSKREPCVRGARVFGSHGAGVSALVAGDD